MPVQYDQRFSEWMATPPQTGRLVEGAYIYGNPQAGALRYARGIFEPATLPDEYGVQQTWAPANFDLELPERRASLNIQMTLTFQGLRGDTARALDRMPPEYLSGITGVRLYSWIVPGAMDVPLVLPPPRFVVEQFVLSSNRLQLECSGPLLPNWRAGEVYTVEKFPGLSTE